jgi:hypothetical protein
MYVKLKHLFSLVKLRHATDDYYVTTNKNYFGSPDLSD